MAAGAGLGSGAARLLPSLQRPAQRPERVLPWLSRSLLPHQSWVGTDTQLVLLLGQYLGLQSWRPCDWLRTSYLLTVKGFPSAKVPMCLFCTFLLTIVSYLTFPR